jgi:glycosyltransferase involved in cell wall biosynthesis
MPSKKNKKSVNNTESSFPERSVNKFGESETKSDFIETNSKEIEESLNFIEGKMVENSPLQNTKPQPSPDTTIGSSISNNETQKFNYFQTNEKFKPRSIKVGSLADSEKTSHQQNYNLSNKNNKKRFFPIVSVCTPTFNRRPFIPIMFECFKNQDYPKSAIEWIIVDDGTDPIEDLIKESNIENIKYYRLYNKIPLGEKRNFMHTKCSGSIIVYMDDDDYYPPERISHAVERLNSNKDALCAGSSEIYIYFKHISKMIQCGPYMPTHATAGTFAFRVELLKQTHYENHAALAEEKAFLKNFTIPFVQLNPMKTILVFSHNHNTFDKKRLLENMHPQYCKESPKTVEDFIRCSPLEDNIKQFFVNDIDNLLKSYSPGEPSMKPDVLKDIKRIEKEREEMVKKQIEENALNNSGKIMFQQEGMPPVELHPTKIVELLQNNQHQMQMMMQKINEQEQTIKKLQELLLRNSRNEV